MYMFFSSITVYLEHSLLANVERFLACVCLCSLLTNYFGFAFEFRYRIRNCSIFSFQCSSEDFHIKYFGTELSSVSPRLARHTAPSARGRIVMQRIE